MKFIFLILLIGTFTKIVFSENLFDSEEYILKFNSENLNIEKQEKIDEIKINSFESILKKILTVKKFEEVKKNINIFFVNKFILNMTINDEKIINNNYYAKIKINFNENSIINYFISNKINYVDYFPNKFLIIIFEENQIESNLFSKKNKYYKFLLKSDTEIFSNYFLIPNLDYNDRYIFNKKDFEIDLINKINLINNKYKTRNQILLHSQKINDVYYIRTYLINSNNFYLVDQKKINDLNFNLLFLDIYKKTLDKWKDLNKIDTNLTNTIVCKINISNIYELKHVRKTLKFNRIIKSFELLSIRFNENIYKIEYFGDINVFKRSLHRKRFKLILNNNLCNVKLV